MQNLPIWYKTQLHLSTLRSIYNIDDAKGNSTSSFVSNYFYQLRNWNVKNQNKVRDAITLLLRCKYQWIKCRLL